MKCNGKDEQTPCAAAQKVLQAVQTYGMLRSGHVLLGLSGGADSVSLMHILCSLRASFGFSLEAAHVHHGLRGEAADADEAFVRALCAEWDVPLHVLHVDVAAEAARSGEGLEACGRRIRYAYFDSLAKGEIATAHTADDNAETMLLHLARGSGLNGLCGIAPVRGRLIRPLILCKRVDVEDYCAENALSFVTDESNFSDVFARNRIRLHAMPALRQVNPAAVEAMTRCSALLRQEEAYLRQQTETLLQKAACPFGYDARTLRESHPALRSRAALRILASRMTEAPAAAEAQTVCRLLETGGKAQIRQDVTACVYGGVLYFDRPPRPDWQAPIVDGEAVLPFGRAIIHISDRKKIQIIHKQDLANCLSCDTIHGEVFFRSRQSGDGMTRANSACRKPMKKLFEEQRIPAPFRADVPILTDGSRVLWAEGIGCDDEFAVRETTRRVMRIGIIREEV